MKGRKYVKELLIVGTICLLMLLSFQPVVGESFEENNDPEPLITYHNCIVWILGSTNNVDAPFTWLFGVYLPLFKKNIRVQAKDEDGEKLNVFVRGLDGVELGSWLSIEKLDVQMNGATGILFWAGKSLIVQGNRIFLRCKAESVNIFE